MQCAKVREGYDIRQSGYTQWATEVEASSMLPQLGVETLIHEPEAEHDCRIVDILK